MKVENIFENSLQYALMYLSLIQINAMKNMIAFILIYFGISFSLFAQTQTGYLLVHENDIKKDEPAPHNGNGTTTAFSFFSNIGKNGFTFRKRALHKGASIGYHLQKTDEVYYILSGTGEMKINDEVMNVKTGDAVLTMPGNSHWLQQTGNEDLVILICYGKEN